MALTAWDDLIKEEGRIRKHEEKLVYTKQAQQRMIRDYTIMGVALFIGCACIFWGIWFVSVAVTSK